MSLRVSDQAWNPNQHAKERQHEGHQANRKPCLAINKDGNRRESKCDRREYRPKRLTWRNPLWNQVGGRTKIEYLTQRKRNRADSDSKARHSAERYRPCYIRLGCSVQGNRT